MTAYFNSPDKILVLEKEAIQWVGTPFAAHQSVKRGGVDCVRLVAALYIATGFLREFNPPRYAMGEGNHRHNSKLLEWFDGRTDFERHELAEGMPMPGDTLCFNMSLSGHHAGIMLQDGWFLHALPSRFVLRSDLRESLYRRKIIAIFRPLNLPKEVVPPAKPISDAR